MNKHLDYFFCILHTKRILLFLEFCFLNFIFCLFALLLDLLTILFHSIIALLLTQLISGQDYLIFVSLILNFFHQFNAIFSILFLLNNYLINKIVQLLQLVKPWKLKYPSLMVNTYRHSILELTIPQKI